MGLHCFREIFIGFKVNSPKQEYILNNEHQFIKIMDWDAGEDSNDDEKAYGLYIALKRDGAGCDHAYYDSGWCRDGNIFLPTTQEIIDLEKMKKGGDGPITIHWNIQHL